MRVPCIQRNGSVRGAWKHFFYIPSLRKGARFHRWGNRSIESEETRPLSAVVRHQSKQSWFPGFALTHPADSAFSSSSSWPQWFCLSPPHNLFLRFQMRPYVCPELCIREHHTIQFPSIESKHKNAVVPDLSLMHTWCTARLKPI